MVSGVMLGNSLVLSLAAHETHLVQAELVLERWVAFSCFAATHLSFHSP